MDPSHPATVPATPGLSDLFPVGTGIAWCVAPVPGGCLLPAEQQAISWMAPARQQAFAQGRACARFALAQIGYGNVAVPVAEQRAPLWPPGVTGSIAHCAGRAIAVAARVEVASGVGVDLEQAGSLERGVLELVCTPAERDWLAQTGNAQLARTIFAIKESVYKCLWPRVRRYIDFQEVEIDLRPAGRRYVARATGPGLDASVVAAINGGWLEAGGLIYASAYLPSAPAL
ncbi:MAG: 4'-phosphopantetheinyl transferase superfamily protein [Chromatiales bacterium]|nr:MAG: 4'-phosphopantetheinyl transferase superfamily protein [Chromatiales bacterium]